MRIRSLALCIVIAAVAAPAFAAKAPAAAAGPSALVSELGAEVKVVLGDTGLTATQRQQRLRALLDEDFDFPLISRFVLGHYWQVSSEASRQEFGTVFEDYVIQSLSIRFAFYSGESMAIKTTRAEGERTTIVSTTIDHPDGDRPEDVDWRVETTSAGFKIADVDVSGVSMATTYRDQFAAVLDQNGGRLDALIPALRHKLIGQPGGTSTASTQAKMDRQ